MLGVNRIKWRPLYVIFEIRSAVERSLRFSVGRTSGHSEHFSVSNFISAPSFPGKFRLIGAKQKMRILVFFLERAQSQICCWVSRRNFGLLLKLRAYVQRQLQTYEVALTVTVKIRSGKFNWSAQCYSTAYFSFISITADRFKSIESAAQRVEHSSVLNSQVK